MWITTQHTTSVFPCTYSYEHELVCIQIHTNKLQHKTETDMIALNVRMSWLVSLEAAFREPGDWMRPFESWLVRGRSIVKDSWASCFLLSLWGQWAANMRRLCFYHPLSPSPHTSPAASTMTVYPSVWTLISSTVSFKSGHERNTCSQTCKHTVEHSVPTLQMKYF